MKKFVQIILVVPILGLAACSLDKAIASVSEKFGTTQIDIQVNTANENGAWKIDNIICPSP